VTLLACLLAASLEIIRYPFLEFHPAVILVHSSSRLKASFLLLG